MAIFDFDGTLTRRDTLLPFLRHALGTSALALRLVLLLPVLSGMVLGLLSRDRAKEIVLRRCIGGMLAERLAQMGRDFAAERLPAMMRRAALEKLAWHRSRGHRCIVASASLAIYVEPWARAAGFDDVVATELEYDAAGHATGRFAGGNCRGQEKLRRLEARCGDLRGCVAYGYGDSPDDRPFLERCDEAGFRPFRAPENRFGDFVALMRPHQWVKNAFVFVGVIFGHAWGAPPLLLAALLAAAGFSFVSSAVYIVNDYIDRERDRAHPKKRHRPLAAGRVSEPAALGLAALLVGAGFGLAGAASPVVLAIVALYAALNVAYSCSLKNVVILDVFLIASGFILRILAGTVGIGVPPSQWLLVCSMFLTLFLGFTKRRSELLSAGGDAAVHRQALLRYNPALLDKMIGVCAGAALMSYSLYTMSPATVRAQGTENLIYTIPFVAYGMFRYLYLLHAQRAGIDASRELAGDPHLVVTVLAWGAATLFFIL